MSSADWSLVIPVSTILSDHRRLLLRWTLDRYAAFWDMPRILGFDGSAPFNRARARNNGLAKVKTEFVIIADGDTGFDFVAMEEGMGRAAMSTTWIIPYGDKDYYNLTHAYTESILGDPLDPIKEPAWDHRLKSWAGLLMARTEDCLALGGYDERFTGWGWEDIAFRIKMDAEIGRHKRVYSGRALHLWHPRGDDEFDTPNYEKNRILFDREYRRKYNWRDERLR